MEQDELYSLYNDPLVELLKLDKYDRSEQDWEWIISDSDRVEEFINFYKENELKDFDRLSLMEIILDSYNQRVWNGNQNIDIWNEISALLKSDLQFFKEELMYWSSMNYSDNELEDAWAIATDMRKLLKIAIAHGYISEDEDGVDWCNDAKRSVI